MSNVFKRLRQKTGLEFMDTSVEIHVELLHYLMREENVPKRYRFIYVTPILNQESQMRIFITQANSIYANTDYQVEERKNLIQKSINCCESIIRLLQDMVFGLNMSGERIDKLDRIGANLLRESELLRAWKKSTKLINKK